MADMVNLLIAKHPRHLVCSALPPKNNFHPQTTYNPNSAPIIHLISIVHCPYNTTLRHVHGTHPSTRIHPLHDPSLDDPLADRQSQSQPQNPNPTPPPTIRMEAHIRLCEADQLPMRLIPLHTDYRNLLPLILRCTATTLVEDLTTCMLFAVRSKAQPFARMDGWWSSSFVVCL